MAGFFDFLPDTTSSPGLQLPSFDTLLLKSLPTLTQALFRGRRQTSLEQLTTGFLRQVIGGARNPSGGNTIPTPPIIPSGGAPSSGYFRASQGQSLAQMASAIARASQRYL